MDPKQDLTGNTPISTSSNQPAQGQADSPMTPVGEPQPLSDLPNQMPQQSTEPNPQPSAPNPFANMSATAPAQTPPENPMPTNTSNETSPVSPIFSTPQTSNPQTEAQPAPAPAAPTQEQPSMNTQTTSPFDTPPAPPTQQQASQNPTNLQGAVVENKTKKKMPVFLIILLVLVAAVLITVGYLAYQNKSLLQKVASPSTTNDQSLSVPPTTTPSVDYVSFRSTILPLEFMVPSDWKTQEQQNNELSNQKMITSSSNDFQYKAEGGDVASGFELQVGPVSDLTKKYDTFEAFSAEENADNSFTQKTINGNTWLVKGNKAETLIDNSPLTVNLYSGPDQADAATTIFGQILNSMKITASNTPAPTTAATSSPSATPATSQ